jgi:hypothetical protein
MENITGHTPTKPNLATFRDCFRRWADLVYQERMRAAELLRENSVIRSKLEAELDKTKDSLRRAARLGYFEEPDGQRVAIPASTRGMLSQELKRL